MILVINLIPYVSEEYRKFASISIGMKSGKCWRDSISVALEAPFGPFVFHSRPVKEKDCRRFCMVPNKMIFFTSFQPWGIQDFHVAQFV